MFLLKLFGGGFHYKDDACSWLPNLEPKILMPPAYLASSFTPMRKVKNSWEVNYNGVVKSTDNGATWERVYDLTWVESATSKHATKAENNIKQLAEQAVEGLDSDADIGDLANRVAPNFGQIFPIDGKDGYIYILGIPGGRNGGTKLGRVLKEKFE